MVLSSRLAVGIVAVAAFTSCGAPADEAGTEPTAAPTTTGANTPATEVPMSTEATSSTAAADDPLEAQAIADLATR
jgi:hypothetical protein